MTDLHKAPTVLPMQVLKDERYLRGEDSPLAGAFELFIVRSYEDLQIKRRGLMQEIATRGAAHG